MEVNETKTNFYKIGLLGALYISGPLFFALTQPDNLPLPLLVLPFIWLFAVLFSTSWLILKRRHVVRRRALMVSTTVAAVPVLLALFQSIHQLSLRDVLLSVGLVVLVAFYVLRADFIK